MTLYGSISFCALWIKPWPAPTHPQSRSMVKSMKTAQERKKHMQMDEANRARCWAFRNPPRGFKKMKYSDIIKVVVKKDGKTHPKISAVEEAAKNFLKVKGTRGRKEGWRKTSKQEDRTMMAIFKKMRPDGCYVDSRIVHKALPKKIKKKILRRTVIRRLADKGFTPTVKVQKSDPGPALMKKREGWCKDREDMKARTWRAELQGVADITEFTWYPKQLRAKFAQLRSRWTYMRPEERMKAAFVRPKRWFKRSEYKKTQKQKVFGLTASNGKALYCLVPRPFSTIKWAKMVKNRVAPFLKKTFPRRSTFQILLDGEPLLHGDEAKAAMADAGISVLPDWPKYSPELNPQENVWAWAENELRELESDDDSFEEFKKLTLKACRAYPGHKKLVGSMEERIAECIESKGAMIGR